MNQQTIRNFNQINQQNALRTFDNVGIDQTTKAIVIGCTHPGLGEHILSIGDHRFTAYSNGTIYQQGDQVIVLTPGDSSIDKFILGKVNTTNANLETELPIDLNKYKQIGEIILYEQQEENGNLSSSILTQEQLASLKSIILNENCDYLIMKLNLLVADFDSSNEYSISIKDSEKPIFVFNSTDVIGQPFALSNQATQIKIFKNDIDDITNSVSIEVEGLNSNFRKLYKLEIYGATLNTSIETKTFLTLIEDEIEEENIKKKVLKPQFTINNVLSSSSQIYTFELWNTADSLSYSNPDFVENGEWINLGNYENIYEYEQIIARQYEWFRVKVNYEGKKYISNNLNIKSLFTPLSISKAEKDQNIELKLIGTNSSLRTYAWYKKEAEELEWSLIENENGNSLEIEKDDLASVNLYIDYKCEVIQRISEEVSRLLESAEIRLINQQKIDAIKTGYSVKIINGDQAILYNEWYDLEHQPLSLSLEVYAPGSTESLIYSEDYTVEWEIPESATLINSIEQKEENANEWELIVNSKFDYNATNNIIKCIITINNAETIQGGTSQQTLTLVAFTDLQFIRQGNLGSNGTGYICRFVNENGQQVRFISSSENFYSMEVFSTEENRKLESSEYTIEYESFPNENNIQIIKGTASIARSNFTISNYLSVVKDPNANFDLNSGYSNIIYSPSMGGTSANAINPLPNGSMIFNFNSDIISLVEKTSFGFGLSKLGKVVTIIPPAIIAQEGIAIIKINEHIEIPIYLTYNQYEYNWINNWNGTDTTINNDYIISQKAAFGVKGEGNEFSGIVAGSVTRPGASENESITEKGIFGYGSGKRNFFLNSDTGTITANDGVFHGNVEANTLKVGKIVAQINVDGTFPTDGEDLISITSRQYAYLAENDSPDVATIHWADNVPASQPEGKSILWAKVIKFNYSTGSSSTEYERLTGQKGADVKGDSIQTIYKYQVTSSMEIPQIYIIDENDNKVLNSNWQDIKPTISENNPYLWMISVTQKISYAEDSNGESSIMDEWTTPAIIEIYNSIYTDAELKQLNTFIQLTKGGTSQGLYYDKKDLYVNAEYIRAGALTVGDADKPLLYANIDGEAKVDIAGFHVKEDSLYSFSKDNDKQGIGLSNLAPNMTNLKDFSTDQNPAIWAGAKESERANAPFRVTQTGGLYAQDAIIEGNITADVLIANNKGEIAGWQIQENKLSYNNELELTLEDNWCVIDDILISLDGVSSIEQLISIFNSNTKRFNYGKIILEKTNFSYTFSAEEAGTLPITKYYWNYGVSPIAISKEVIQEISDINSLKGSFLSSGAMFATSSAALDQYMYDNPNGKYIPYVVYDIVIFEYEYQQKILLKDNCLIPTWDTNSIIIDSEGNSIQRLEAWLDHSLKKHNLITFSPVNKILKVSNLLNELETTTLQIDETGIYTPQVIDINNKGFELSYACLKIANPLAALPDSFEIRSNSGSTNLIASNYLFIDSDRTVFRTFNENEILGTQRINIGNRQLSDNSTLRACIWQDSLSQNGNYGLYLIGSFDDSGKIKNGIVITDEGVYKIVNGSQETTAIIPF